jgi:ribokinase
MTIFNLGSINADIVYRVPHLPTPGETLACDSMSRGLGGKGTNMSVAAARAAARVVHIGAVGPDGVWAKDRLLEYGVDTRHIAVLDQDVTGHAIIYVDGAGENSIVLYAGTNRMVSHDMLDAALSQAGPADTLLMQNETNAQVKAAKLARAKGVKVAYAAAPFVAAAVRAVLEYCDFLILNQVEAAQLQEATGLAPEALPVRDVIVTLGAQGSRWHQTETGESRTFPAIAVDVVDTTGAGDTFTGYVLAGLDRGLPMGQSIAQATRAAALQVPRLGAADVIPHLKDFQDAVGKT